MVSRVGFTVQALLSTGTRPSGLYRAMVPGYKWSIQGRFHCTCVAHTTDLARRVLRWAELAVLAPPPPPELAREFKKEALISLSGCLGGNTIV